MTAVTLKPTVQDLQKDVIQLLEDISGLMHRAHTTLSSESTSDRYVKFKQEIDGERHKVENLELRMAIVAPMKAGKSTIVNAIVGQELLPSRNAAMTTLPTEIVFNGEVQEPVLILDEEILSVFQETQLALQHKVQTLGLEPLKAKIADYPHLQVLLQEIQVSFTPSIPTKLTGQKQITETLTRLNDLVRLCALLEPSRDPLNRLSAVPRIETPFWRSQTNSQSDLLGNLVIVDTPGPNEAGENLKLGAVVDQELKKCGIVLIVLDFTQLKTEAAEKIKQSVQQIARSRGKENLYVLINKVDQRREGDMSSEQVKQFVSANLGLGDSNRGDRVFEVSAIRAFVAAKYMLELQQFPEIEVSAMETAAALAQEALGARWKEKLKRASQAELQEEAAYLWEDSGFEVFLGKAIGALMEGAAPRCMRSALSLSRTYLNQLREAIELRTHALDEDAKKLQDAVEALDTDLRRLDTCRSGLKKVDDIKTALQAKLSATLETLKQRSTGSLKNLFGRKEFEQANLVGKVGLGFKRFGEVLLKQEYESSKVIEFDSATEADEFIEFALNYAKWLLENDLTIIRENASKQVEQSCQQLLAFLDRETRDIIEKARQRLNKTFDVNLSAPPIPEWNAIDFGKTKSEQRTRYKTEYQKKKVRPFYFLFLIEIDKEVSVQKTETYYTVSLQDLQNSISKSIQDSIKTINQAINQYLDEDFQARINQFFNDLDAYLRDYRNELKQVQADQQRSVAERQNLAEALELFAEEANQMIDKADVYCDRTQQLMPNSHLPKHRS